MDTGAFKRLILQSISWRSNSSNLPTFQDTYFILCTLCSSRILLIVIRNFNADIQKVAETNGATFYTWRSTWNIASYSGTVTKRRHAEENIQESSTGVTFDIAMFTYFITWKFYTFILPMYHSLLIFERRIKNKSFVIIYVSVYGDWSPVC